MREVWITREVQEMNRGRVKWMKFQGKERDEWRNGYPTTLTSLCF